MIEVQSSSEAMALVSRELAVFARIPRPMVLVGPSGVGKGVLARRCHDLSGRTGEFIQLTGGELSESLFHSQLFGHEAGAFTGAVKRRRGVLERAAGGTLFIDEVPLWSRAAQSALLRVLSERRFSPLGSERDIPATCRFVFASTVPLSELVHDGRLLPDLMYRMQWHVLRVPGLAERPGDILPIASAILRRAVEEFGLGPLTISHSAVAWLLGATWPGNVRELETRIEKAAVRAAADLSGAVEAHHLEEDQTGTEAPPVSPTHPWHLNVEWALEQTRGHRGKAAELLGVHRNTIGRRARRMAS